MWLCRCERDRHRCHAGARPGPEARDGSHQGDPLFAVVRFVFRDSNSFSNTLIIYSEPQTEPHTLPQNVGFKPQHLHLDLRLYIHVYKYVWFISALNVSSSLQDQFEFALTAVAEEVNAILKALPQWPQRDPPDTPPPCFFLRNIKLIWTRHIMKQHRASLWQSRDVFRDTRCTRRKNQVALIKSNTACPEQTNTFKSLWSPESV